jgi:hypothetical protein
LYISPFAVGGVLGEDLGDVKRIGITVAFPNLAVTHNLKWEMVEAAGVESIKSPSPIFAKTP